MSLAKYDRFDHLRQALFLGAWNADHDRYI